MNEITYHIYTSLSEQRMNRVESNKTNNSCLIELLVLYRNNWNHLTTSKQRINNEWNLLS